MQKPPRWIWAWAVHAVTAITRLLHCYLEGVHFFLLSAFEIDYLVPLSDECFSYGGKEAIYTGYFINLDVTATHIVNSYSHEYT